MKKLMLLLGLFAFVNLTSAQKVKEKSKPVKKEAAAKDTSKPAMKTKLKKDGTPDKRYKENKPAMDTAMKLKTKPKETKTKAKSK
jgi:colicin import membrane protein